MGRSGAGGQHQPVVNAMSQPFDHRSFLNTVTERPGVYQMLDGEGEVLYVGKARNLRQRLASYFRSSGLSLKTKALVERIRQIQVTVTRTETEALRSEERRVGRERGAGRQRTG